MLIPLIRASRVLAHTTMPSHPPSFATLNASLTIVKEFDKVEPPKSGKLTDSEIPASDKIGTHRLQDGLSTNDSGAASPKIYNMFGTSRAEKILGPLILRYVIGRHYSVTRAMTSGEGATPFETMNEPYGSIIDSLQSKFQRAGLIRVQQDKLSVTFSDGTRKLQIVTDPDTLPSETGYFIDIKGRRHSIGVLQKQFNPEVFYQELGDLKSILERFGVEDVGLSQAAKDDGIRDYLSLSFRQMINFMDSNKQALSKL